MQLRKKWGIDVDGVLAIFDRQYIKLLKELDPDPALAARLDAAMPPTSWNWTGPCGVSAQLEADSWRKIIDSPDFWESLEDYPETAPFLALVDAMQQEAGLQVYFITTRPGHTSKQQTERWLSARGLRNPTVLICLGPKASVINGLGLDLMIDDRPDAVLKLEQDCPQTTIYCQDRTWNRDIVARNRVSGVREMLQKEGVLA